MEKINLDEILEKQGNPVDSQVEDTDQEVQEENQVEEIQEEVEQPHSEEEIEQPSSEEDKPSNKEVEEPVDEFPSDKFDGKFSSWEEVQEALNKEPEQKEVEYKDDFIKKVVETYNNKGSLEDFFKAYSTNWKDMPHEEVLKTKFKEDNGDLDNKTLDYAWKKQLSKYGDPDLLSKSDDELEDDEITEKRYVMSMMKKDAENVRKEKLSEQESYLQPQQEKEPEVKFEDVRKQVINRPDVQNFIKENKLSYKIGDSDFKLEVTDRDKIIDTLADERLFINSFIKDGQPDVQGWIDTVNYRMNGEKVRQALVDHGRSLEREAIVNEDYKNTTMKKNPSKPQEETNHAVGLFKEFQKAFSKKN